MNSPALPVKRLLLFCLGTAAAFFFFFKTFVDLPQLGDVLGSAALPALLWAIVVILPTPLLSALRWFALLRASGHTFPLGRIIRITVAAMSFIAIPGRLGDLVRCYPLRYQARTSRLVATIIAEKIIDVAVLCMLSALGFALTSQMPLALGMFFLSIVVLGTMSLSRYVPHQIQVSGIIEKLNAAAEVFKEITRKPTWIVVIISVSALNWSISLISTWFLFIALGGPVPFTAILAYLPLAIFAGLIPFGLAGTGTRDAAFLALFAPFAPSAVILATSIGYSALGYLLFTIIGLPFLRNLRSDTPVPTVLE